MEKFKADSLITEYLPKIYGFAVSKCFSYDEAEDLASDIVTELYKTLLSSEEVYNPDGFIWRISNFTYSKYVAEKKKHVGVSLDNVTLSYFDEYDLGESDEEILRLRREIAFLTKVRREIVYSYYYENKQINEIALERGMPEGTVKWHLSKARLDIRKGFNMERKIGKLGLSPVRAVNYGHSGNVGTDNGHEYYLGDSLSLNIVYSVYFEPKTKDEIAEELGVTPVFISDRIDTLEENGFLIPTSGGRYTTYVMFSPTAFSQETLNALFKKKLEVAAILAGDYAKKVREAVKDTEVYIPGSNRELFEAAAIFWCVSELCNVPVNRDISRYFIKTTTGGNFIAHIDLEQTQTDKDVAPAFDFDGYKVCGSMFRSSCKYPVSSWSSDSKLDSRTGYWKNNLSSDFDYVYEHMTGKINDDKASEEKYKRLKERGFVTEDGKVNIMIVKSDHDKFRESLPALDDQTKKEFADYALEAAELEARFYPPQMRDLVISDIAGGFIKSSVAVMVLDILYENGTFKPLTENEKVTANLLMFSDVLPG